MMEYLAEDLLPGVVLTLITSVTACLAVAQAELGLPDAPPSSAWNKVNSALPCGSALVLDIVRGSTHGADIYIG